MIRIYLDEENPGTLPDRSNPGSGSGTGIWVPPAPAPVLEDGFLYRKNGELIPVPARLLSDDSLWEPGNA